MYRLYRRNLNAPRPLAVTILGIRSTVYEKEVITLLNLWCQSNNLSNDELCSILINHHPAMLQPIRISLADIKV